MDGKKEKLNLTISPGKKALAREVAKLRHRSLSSLFEVLVNEEWERVKRICPPKRKRNNHKK